MAFWDRKKDVKPHDEQAQDLETRIKEFDPKYDQPARTDLMHIPSDDGADQFVFRKMERSPNGNWNVHAVTIYDISKVLKRKVEALVKGDKDVKVEDNDSNIVVKVETLGFLRDKKETNELTYLEGMKLMAELQRRATDETSNCTYADPSDIAQILKIADAKLVQEGLEQQEFDALEHFRDVADREGIVFTVRDEALPLVKGRLKHDGAISITDLARVKKAADEAEQNPPDGGTGMDADLLSAFNDVMMPNKMEAFLQGSRVLLETDKIMKEMAEVAKSFIKLLNEPTESDWLDEVKAGADNCEYACNNSHKLSGIYVDKYKEILLRTKLSANIMHAKALKEAITNDTGSVEKHAMRIEQLKNESAELVRKIDPMFKSDNAAQLIVDENFLRTFIEDYNQKRSAYQEGLKAKPANAAEKAKVFADVKTPVKKTAKKVAAAKK